MQESKPTVTHKETRQPFLRRTRHPIYKEKVLKAEWIPDYFGLNQAGVRFPGETKVYHPRELIHGNGREPYV